MEGAPYAGSRSAIGIRRTANTPENRHVDTEALILDAFAQLRLETRLADSTPGGVADLVLDLGGVDTRIVVTRRALVTDDDARRLLDHLASDHVLVVVGDRVTEKARGLLTSSGSGYYDLRGRFVLRTDRIVIDVEVEPVLQRAGRTAALSGKAGLEVAVAVLMQPTRAVVVRELARELGRSASTVSEVLTALRRDGLIDPTNAVVGAGLFWAVADRWVAPPTYLSQVPLPGDGGVIAALRLGLRDVEGEAGWALTDSVAAAVYGAPVVVRSGQLLDFYVPDQTLVRRATTLLEPVSSSATASCSIRVAPVPAVCRQRIDPDTNATEWPVAHPLFVALDLAQDLGRGREILEGWTPDGRWSHVW